MFLMGRIQPQQIRDMCCCLRATFVGNVAAALHVCESAVLKHCINTLPCGESKHCTTLLGRRAR